MDIFGKSITRSGRLFGIVLASALFAAGSGCVLLDGGMSAPPPEPPPLPVNDVMTIWDPRIRIAEDPVNNGAPLPGLAGRVYLVNDELKRMVDAQGSIVVAIRVTTAGASSGQSSFAVRCEFKEPDLKRLKKKDLLGDGYTLFVPWETYQPEIKQIEVQVCYAPKGGKLHYSAPTPILLRTENRFQIERREQVIGQTPPQR